MDNNIMIITNISIYSAIELWFSNCEECIKYYGHISNWNTSKVTNMFDLFAKRYYFNEDISKWDTSNVINMSYMFYECYNFNQQLKWNTSKVTDMSCMFFNCKNLNKPIIFNTENVTDMSYMFYKCYNFNQRLNFNTDKVTNMTCMFFSCYNFNKHLTFNVKNVVNMQGMFADCIKFNQSIYHFNTNANHNFIVENVPKYFRTIDPFNKYDVCYNYDRRKNTLILYRSNHLTSIQEKVFCNKDLFITIISFI